MSAIVLWLRLVALSSAYEQISLRKPTFQHYQHIGFPPDILTSRNATDELRSNLSSLKRECVFSAITMQTLSLQVNLTSIHSIHHITIRHKAGPNSTYASNFLGFSLYVSNTTNISDGTLCFKDTSFTTSTIPAVFNATCPVHGQYVIYSNLRILGVTYNSYFMFMLSFNSICDLDVFGCPIPGFYGYNCSIPCPDPHCRYCHIETGTCQGCKPGFQGHSCELVCPFGFFGDGCVRKCKKTCNGCNNVDGSCDIGCYPGWKGDHCQEQCAENYFGLNCEKMCNATCKGCNKITGVCENGCHPDWKGAYCHQGCVQIIHRKDTNSGFRNNTLYIYDGHV